MIQHRWAALERCDEIDRNHAGALMQQLEKRVLPIGARFAPNHWATRYRQRIALQIHRLAVALHFELLQVRRQAVQILRVGLDAVARRTPKIVVPNAEHAEHDGHIGFKRRSREMFVHCMRACEEFVESIHANRKRNGESHRRPQRVAATDPIPKPKNVVFADAELAHGFRIG